MNISICITVLNEESTISSLLDSLLSQSKKPDEIIIVDGGSSDRTISIIRHFQKKDKSIKLLTENCSRSKGRNIGIEIARNEIIAITDGGCLPDKDWLKKITEPFRNERVDISAGFYKMIGENNFEKAESIFLGTTPRKFSINFLPSARSMAFRKKVWEEVGGFPEGDNNSAEDTDFNYKAIKARLKYSRVKDAIVGWGMPKDLNEFFNKIKDYAKWDASYGIWWNPAQRYSSHNIKVLSVVVRYLLGLILFFLSFNYSPLFPILLFLFLVYLIWAFRKVFLEFERVDIAIWGPVLQITADIAVISGFFMGILGR